MTLTQAQAILEVCFKREHRAYVVWQRAKTNPTETDIIKMLSDGDYVSNLETKQKQWFASCQYWEERIKKDEYWNIPFDAVGSKTWSNKKYFKLGDIA